MSRPVDCSEARPGVVEKINSWVEVEMRWLLVILGALFIATALTVPPVRTDTVQMRDGIRSFTHDVRELRIQQESR